MKKIVVILFLVGVSNPAHALEWITGKVTHLEPSYMPGSIAFRMDTGNATCPVGTWLTWSRADVENTRHVYATLMAALVGAKRINFIINDGDSSCHGQHLHLLSN